MRPAQGEPHVFNRIFIVYAKDSGLTEEDFREHFEQFGNIIQVHISLEKETGKPRGYTYIRYGKTSEACLAVEGMNGKEIMKSRKLGVHIAHEKKDNLEVDVDKDEMLQRIFVRHSKSEPQEKLKEYFSQFGNIIWMYCLKDSKTKESRGSSFIKYERQSEAATAIEECQRTYKARWADVRVKEEDQSMGGSGGMDMGGAGGGQDYGYMGQAGLMGSGMGAMGMSSHGGAGAMNRGMGNMSSNGGPMDYVSSKQGGISNRLEALVPSDLSQQQVYRLFDIAPGLQGCTIDTNTGLAKLEYATGQCAAHARDKIDGLDIYGYTIAVRFAKAKIGLENTAQQLQDTLANLQASGGRGAPLDSLVQSIAQVTQALQAQGMGGGDSDAMQTRVPWCSVMLPPRKPMLPRGSPEGGKLFFLTKPQTVNNDVMLNAFSRFGTLIGCNFTPGKNYGFAHFGSLDSAKAALNTLNGCNILDNQLKVEISTSTGGKDKDGQIPAKRPRQW